MNSRIRIILILVSITAVFALSLILSLSAFAAEVNQEPQLIPPTAGEPQTIPAAPDEDYVINITPVGDGSVTKDPDKTTYSGGEVVTLTAVPASPAWEFVSYSGDLITTNYKSTITVNKSYNITATFKQRCFQLTLSHTGSGSDPAVTSGPSAVCSTGLFAAGEVIQFSATAVEHWKVAGWSGTVNNSSTQSTNQVTMPAQNHAVSVSYAPICYSLTLLKSPQGSGNITPSAQQPCPADSSKYLEGANVGLTATAANGYKFKSWTGTNDDSKTTNTNTVTMSSDKTVTANFELACRPLTVTHNPPGSGSDPMPQNNSSVCSPGEYVAGELIDFEAEPKDELYEKWRVEKWKGTNNDSSTSTANTLTFPALPSGAGHVVEVHYIQLPTLEFASASYQVNENEPGGVAKIQVKRSGSITESVDVRYLTTDGTAVAKKNNVTPYDYIKATGKLTFGPGISQMEFEVQIHDDDISEGKEYLNLTLYDASSNAVLGESQTARLDILDDEGALSVQFLTPGDAQEISPTMPISISLNAPSASDLYVEFRTEPGTAASGQDYVEHSEIVPFFAGETVKQVEVEILDDTLDEPPETILLKLFQPNNGPLLDETTLTIIDNDAPSSLKFSSNEYFAKEGDLTTPVSVTLNAASGFSVTVKYEVIQLSVGRQLIGNLTFEPGETTKIVDIPVSAYQVGDTLNIILSEPEHATLSTPSSASLIILDKNRSDCYPLTMSYTGYGSQPITTNLEKSLGCPVGQFVADELIFVSAQPDSGWSVDSWFGTLDDKSKAIENIVRMPERAHQVSVFYITHAYMPVVFNKYTTYFNGNNEKEPNDSLAQANGPIRSNVEYLGDFSSTSDAFDNYYFILDSVGDVQIQLVDVPVGRDYNLLLLSSDQEIVGYSGFLNNSDEFISVRDIEPGLYYVSVHFAKGSTSTAKYRLHVIYD